MQQQNKASYFNRMVQSASLPSTTCYQDQDSTGYNVAEVKATNKKGKLSESSKRYLQLKI